MHPKRRIKPQSKRPMLKDKDMDELVRAAWEGGCWCERAGTKHVKVYPPDGSRMIPIPSTPSDWRTKRNKRAQLRRAGIKV